ncbi:MAG: DUF1830 domain-containing protein [Cyanobacteria bacterium RI_101]|nr:DUF1830 domain-containing protein [Cyanobacteria bacterium RI_101]
MAQILDPLPGGARNALLCCYVNATSHIQIARITNIANWYFERVVFPGQRLVFEAYSEALLEIHSGMMASAILSDTIPCDRLRINDDEDEEEEDVGKGLSHPLAERAEAPKPAAALSSPTPIGALFPQKESVLLPVGV